MGKNLRFGLIGDVHSNDENLDRALRFLQEQNVDAILCVGDIVDGDGDPDRCIELLVASDVRVVRGNHDRWIVTDTARMLPDAHTIDQLTPDSALYLRRLPPTRHIDTPFGTLHLCHGVGNDDMAFLNPDDPDDATESNHELQRLINSGVSWVVGGHTHQVMDRRFGSLRFINPGSIAPLPLATFATLDVQNDDVRYYQIEADGIVELEM